MSTNALNNKEQENRFILQGNLWKVVIRLSWPTIIAMVIYGFNPVLDALFVGQYAGEIALAGISLAYPITAIVTGLGSLIGVGAGSILSIALGANDTDKQRKIMGNVNVLIIFFTVIYMIAGLLLSSQMIQFMGGKGEELLLGDQYFRITVIGTIFWVYGLAINMIIRAEGRMKTAAWMMAVGLIANGIFSYIFIALMNMGVVGAAWGINMGMFIYSFVSFIYLVKGKASFEANALSLTCDKKIIGDINRLGASSLIMSVMTLVQAFVVFNVLSTYGTVSDIAFYGVVFRIFQFFLTPIFGLMRALQPVIGINYGAKQYERVIKSYKLFGVVAMMLTIPLWLISLIFPNEILSTMLAGQNFGSIQLNEFRVFIFIIPFLSFIFMAMTFFPAVDKGKPAAIIGIARQFIFYVPAMLVVPRYFGIEGIYYASFGIDVIIVLWTVLLVKKEFKFLRNNKICKLNIDKF
ncbi:MATE family efflux transporter [Enterococcus sp. DIV1420a]|uniref:MATE family efflux transporter n=1 Tax=Enterococcus sp. DIV1420a TaxID=2774672 RepID=UPI003F28490F